MPRDKFSGEAVAEATPAPAAEPRTELRPVEDWRESLTPEDVPANWHTRRNFMASHAAADVAHGWSQERRDYARAVVITEKDYRAALEASGRCDDKGRVCAHAPALGECVKGQRKV